MGDGLVDGRQRPGREDRAGEDHAARGLLVDDEIGAHPEHRRLERHAEDLGEGAERRGGVGGLVVGVEMGLVGRSKAALTPRPMPMAVTTSALRRVASASVMRAEPVSDTSLIGARVTESVAKARPTRMRARPPP
jgi:hypothetical protein